MVEEVKLHKLHSPFQLVENFENSDTGHSESPLHSDAPCLLRVTKAKFLLTPSIQYQSNIKQTSDEKKEKYQSEHYTLIHYQSLRTNIIRIA